MHSAKNLAEMYAIRENWAYDLEKNAFIAGFNSRENEIKIFKDTLKIIYQISDNAVAKELIAKAIKHEK